MGYKATAICDYKGIWKDFPGNVVGALTIGEIDFVDIKELRKKLLADQLKKGNKINHLEIWAHGDNSGAILGDAKGNTLWQGDMETADRIRPLAGILEDKAIVDFKVCEFGQAKQMLLKISSILSLSCFAYTGDVRFFYTSGNKVCAHPNGKWEIL